MVDCEPPDRRYQTVCLNDWLGLANYVVYKSTFLKTIQSDGAKVVFITIL